jgi:hypothetical protein
MHFCRRVPVVTIERRMNLAALAAARQRCSPRPGWAVLFAKAFALVARNYPEFRRSYMSFPWPRFYEHPSSTAVLNVARQFNDEPIVLQIVIRRPENRSLEELDGMVRRFQVEPVESLRWYQRAMTMSKLPWPIRGFIWWGALNVFGRRRTHNFGTFAVTSVAALGAGVLFPIPLQTSQVHYGLFDPAGNLDVRLSWDHRVFDGVLGARFLVDLERTLHEDILTELARMHRAAAGDGYTLPFSPA